MYATVCAMGNSRAPWAEDVMEDGSVAVVVESPCDSEEEGAVVVRHGLDLLFLGGPSRSPYFDSAINERSSVRVRLLIAGDIIELH